MMLAAEDLEPRWVLTGGVGSNECPPNLNLSGVPVQTATVGVAFSLNLLTAGGTATDTLANGNNLPFTPRFVLDPDSSQTPAGATITSAGVFSWTPTAAQAGQNTIVVILIDQGTPPLADAETFTINVVDGTPIVDLNGTGDAGIDFAATFNVGSGPALIVDTDLSVTDLDSANLSSARIRLTNILDGNLESLSVDTTGTPIVAAAYNATTGVLDLSGTATVAQYQQVLRTLRYNNTDATPTTTARTVEVTVSDGTNTSLAAMSTITLLTDPDPIIDLNGPDAGTGFAATFTEDAGPSLIVDPDLSVSDPDSVNLSSATAQITNLQDGASEVLSVDTTGTPITASYNPATGTLSLTGSASLTQYQQVLRTLRYNNTSQNPGTTARTVEVIVNDGTNASAAAISTVSVTAVNDSPILNVIADQNLDLGNTLSFNAVATDPDNDTLTYSLDPESPAGATINPTTGAFQFIPTAAGTFIITVLVTDDDANPLADSETFTVTVVAVDPIVDLNGSDGAGINFATTFTENAGAVAVTDTDATVTDPDSANLQSATITLTNRPDGVAESLSVIVTGTPITASAYNPATGTITLTGPGTLAEFQQVLRSLLYSNMSEDPDATARVVRISVSDGTNTSTIAESTISVVPVADAPTLAIPPQFTQMGTPFVMVVGNLVNFTAQATDLDTTASELVFTLDLTGSGIMAGDNQPSITSPPGAIPGGVMSWTPSATGTFQFDVVVTDSTNLSGRQTVYFQVNAAPRPALGLPGADQTSDEESEEKSEVGSESNRIADGVNGAAEASEDLSVDIALTELFEANTPYGTSGLVPIAVGDATPEDLDSLV